MNTYKKQGRGGHYGKPSVREKPTSFFPCSMPPCLCACSVFHSPYALPSSVSRNSFVCHSYENCRGVYPKFPVWERAPYCSLSAPLVPEGKKEGAASRQGRDRRCALQGGHEIRI